LGRFFSDDTYIILSKAAQSYNAYINNLTTYTVNEIDLGDGVGWISVSDLGGFIIFTVIENLGNFRNVQVDITDDVSGTTIAFYIGQREYIHEAKLDFSDPLNSVYNSILLTLKT